MKHILLSALLILTFLLVACVSTTVNPLQTGPQPASVSNITPTPTDDPTFLPTLFPNFSGNTDMTRIDQQGTVTIEITPINLGTPADSLEFDVVMNTHSIDLSMDLATLATLTTDTGIILRATLWDAPRGGHHVSGRLIFPAIINGKSMLEGAGKLTLTIVNVDALSRIFEWNLK